MNFGTAIALMKEGHYMCRKGWNGKGMYVAYQDVHRNSKMQHPYLYIKPVDGKIRPRSIDTTSALADDWMISERTNGEEKVKNCDTCEMHGEMCGACGDKQYKKDRSFCGACGKEKTISNLYIQDGERTRYFCSETCKGNYHPQGS